MWLAILLLFCTSVYTGWGLRLEDAEALKEDIRIYWQPGTASLTHDMSMFFTAFLHSLSVMTFLRVSVAEPLHWTGQIWQSCNC